MADAAATKGALKISLSDSRAVDGQGGDATHVVYTDYDSRSIVAERDSTGQRLRSQGRGAAGSTPQVGLFSARPLTLVLLWYGFSAVTLFLNKYILSYRGGDPALLGVVEMIVATALGYFQLYFPLGLYKLEPPKPKSQNFLRNMIVLGSMRFSTVVFGLVALKYVAVSFTETIKSSAPLFTVVIARLLLGEHTSGFVVCSLLPIMVGLALCSAYELSFNTQGLIAALMTNVCECLQFVYSKLLMSGDGYKYNPAELQYYTSAASIVVQIPTCFFMMNFDKVYHTTDSVLMGAILLNAVSFHGQTIVAFALLDCISPVTHSVTNTVKRAFLIWLSVLIFHNPVTLLSGLGTLIVTVGVFLYNKARDVERKRTDTSAPS